MRRIALVGPPGSGKTELAHGIVQRMDGAWDLVDGYVEKLRDETGWAYGHWAGWIANLGVALRRMEVEERVWNSNAVGAVSCGTLVDTLAYAAMHMEIRQASSMPAADDYVRVANVMHTIGMLFNDTWPGRYDHVLLLAPAGDTGHLDDRLYETMESALEVLDVPYGEVRHGDQAIADALATINRDATPAPEE